jgi:hypothetical protein
MSVKKKSELEQLLDRLIELPAFPGEPEEPGDDSKSYCRYGTYEKASSEKWYLYQMGSRLVVRPYGDRDQMRKILGALKHVRSPWRHYEKPPLVKVAMKSELVYRHCLFTLERIRAAGLLFLMWSLDIITVELNFA